MINSLVFTISLFLFRSYSVIVLFCFYSVQFAFCSCSVIVLFLFCSVRVLFMFCFCSVLVLFCSVLVLFCSVLVRFLFLFYSSSEQFKIIFDYPCEVCTVFGSSRLDQNNLQLPNIKQNNTRLA